MGALHGLGGVGHVAVGQLHARQHEPQARLGGIDLQRRPGVLAHLGVGVIQQVALHQVLVDQFLIQLGHLLVQDAQGLGVGDGLEMVAHVDDALGDLLFLAIQDAVGQQPHVVRRIAQQAAQRSAAGARGRALDRHQRIEPLVHGRGDVAQLGAHTVAGKTAALAPARGDEGRGLGGVEMVFRLVLGPEHGHQQRHHGTQHAADGNEEIEEEQIQQQGRARTPVLRRGHLRDGQREQRRGGQVQQQITGEYAQPVAALQQQGHRGGLETQTGSGEFKQHSVPPG